MSSPFPRFETLGVGIHALSLDRALEQVLSARSGTPLGYVCFCTAHGMVEAGKNPELRAAYARAFIAAPDGMPLVWLGRHYGHLDITRVYGPDVMLAACDKGRALGLGHFFYGGTPGVARELALKLQDRFPGLKVAGWRTPPMHDIDKAEFALLHEAVASSRPDLIWVGLGAPKQECFMARHASQLDAGLLLGVGAAFDFFSGRVRQAPRWLQCMGLEWLFRLAQEPRRLGRRYLITTPVFAWRALKEITGRWIDTQES
jgi:N-acetylglucosaminyldiphosphoundecaprenol N-acetyl-beta-D-mannosaminyltransferase